MGKKTVSLPSLQSQGLNISGSSPLNMEKSELLKILRENLGFRYSDDRPTNLKVPPEFYRNDNVGVGVGIEGDILYIYEFDRNDPTKAGHIGGIEYQKKEKDAVISGIARHFKK